MTTRPFEIKVSFCADHGPFIDSESGWPEGCPAQVDYDGITCGYVDPVPTTYKNAGNPHENV